MIGLIICERRDHDLNIYEKEGKDMGRRFGENLQIVKDIGKEGTEERGAIFERYQEICF